MSVDQISVGQTFGDQMVYNLKPFGQTVLSLLAKCLSAKWFLAKSRVTLERWENSILILFFFGG